MGTSNKNTISNGNYHQNQIYHLNKFIAVITFVWFAVLVAIADIKAGK